MPYFDGDSLRDKLDAGERLSVEEAVEIAKVTARALDYAHRHGVVHRDVKPDNILLQDGQPIVADFGIALEETDTHATRLTETGVAIGTPRYMSPEQFTGESEVDGRSDISSLGAVFYEMLTGTPPHTGDSAKAILANLLSRTPTPVGEIREKVPGHVAGAVHRSLAKDPEDRFQTAAEFANAIVGVGVSDDQARLRSGRRATATRLSAMSAVIVVVIVLLWSAWPTPPVGVKSVAVLPLANLTGDTGQAFFLWADCTMR